MPSKPLAVGDRAPLFSLPSGDGETVSLKDYLGRNVILYFYPKDNTSGCTRQACDFRDASKHLKTTGAVVLGISPDSPASHEKFATKFELPFPLLADVDHKVAESYGVWAEKSMYGRKYFGIERSTFLIDPQGRLAAVWRKVKVPGHVDEVLQQLSGEGAVPEEKKKTARTAAKKKS
jgi:peroxiredoxin Q/BCP